MPRDPSNQRAARPFRRSSRTESALILPPTSRRRGARIAYAIARVFLASVPDAVTLVQVQTTRPQTDLDNSLLLETYERTEPHEGPNKFPYHRLRGQGQVRGLSEFITVFLFSYPTPEGPATSDFSRGNRGCSRLIKSLGKKLHKFHPASSPESHLHPPSNEPRPIFEKLMTKKRGGGLKGVGYRSVPPPATAFIEERRSDSGRECVMHARAYTRMRVVILKPPFP